MTDTPDDVQTLRMKYNVAWAAHESCVRALTEARFRGDELPPGVIETEPHARRAMDFAREQLRVAMTDSITGHREILAQHCEDPPFVAELPPEASSDVPKD
jgi:hypothetical protein